MAREPMITDLEVDIALNKALSNNELKKALNQFSKQIKPKEIISTFGKLTHSRFFIQLFSDITGKSYKVTSGGSDLYTIIDLTNVSEEDKRYLESLSKKLYDISLKIHEIKEKAGKPEGGFNIDPQKVQEYMKDRYGKSKLYKMSNQIVNRISMIKIMLYTLALMFIVLVVLYFIFRYKAKTNEKYKKLQDKLKRLAIVVLVISIAFSLAVLLLVTYYRKLFTKSEEELIKAKKKTYAITVIKPNLSKHRNRLRKALMDAANEYKKVLQEIFKTIQTHPQLKNSFYKMTKKQAVALTKRYGVKEVTLATVI